MRGSVATRFSHSCSSVLEPLTAPGEPEKPCRRPRSRNDRRGPDLAARGLRCRRTCARVHTVTVTCNVPSSLSPKSVPLCLYDPRLIFSLRAGLAAMTDVRPPSDASKEAGYGYKGDDIAPAANGGAIDLDAKRRAALCVIELLPVADVAARKLTTPARRPRASAASDAAQSSAGSTSAPSSSPVSASTLMPTTSLRSTSRALRSAGVS